MQIRLDPKSCIKGDYRSLAGKFGMNQNKIYYLETKESPTEALLREIDPTLNELVIKLQSTEVDRSDVGEVILDWLKRHCACEECNPARLT